MSNTYLDNTGIINQVKSIIVDNQDTLVTDLVHQGVQRSIKQITSSTLTHPRDFYFILITVSLSRLYEEEQRISNIGINQGRSTVKPVAEYNVEITVGDEAVFSYTDEEPYEGMDLNFQLFVNRIAKLFLDEHEAGNITLDPIEIIQVNESFTWDEAENFQAMLYSQLRFTLRQECNQNALY